MKKITITILLAYVSICKLSAQIDPHFSQYYANPLWLNPALTGVVDGDIRLSCNVKNQWGRVGTGYQTQGLAVDYRPTNQIGLGFTALSQGAGTAGYKYLAAYSSFSYAVALSNEFEWLNFGLQAGLINRSVDLSKFQTDSQYDPSFGYNPGLPINESLLSENATIFDAGIGVFYRNDNPYKKANYFIGASAAHLSRPNDPFATDVQNYRLPVRLNFHGGVKLTMSKNLGLTPHFIYIRQNKNEIAAVGSYSEIRVENDDTLILGIMYRLDDAILANIGYRVGRLGICASYDFNTSAFNNATRGHGGLEFAFSYTFGKGVIGLSPVLPKF
ncbi:PorP/SprF family type IX secretion system membrane protein [Pedobacter sp. MC2016-14]|uniref:PorP/SprF family type IX secretion system membrane protein n=1 Tax=Pedobacter sp. MC2016-14 TaxID=2897327 RepID=UPI001E31EA9C|nr:PorP/SprF family type IX secretion system membrane protein [Pedobacter sp. MC2016-14]